jgi:hypothetical protein
MASSERTTIAWKEFVALAEKSATLHPGDLEQLCEFLVAVHLDGQPVSYWACETDMAKFAEPVKQETLILIARAPHLFRALDAARAATAATE